MEHSGIIVFCIAVGISLSQMGHEAHVMVQFFVIMDKVIMKLVMTVMWYVSSLSFKIFLKVLADWYYVSDCWKNSGYC